MPSQYGEHELILRYFAGVPARSGLPGEAGRFLDVGAFDGVTFSNTRCLADLGWTGVLVEPSPVAFMHLMKNYAGRSGFELVNAGIATDDSLRQFWSNSVGDASDCMSTYVAEHTAKFPKSPFVPIWTHSLSWSSLLDALPGPYDFVNIDVEGLNQIIVAYMDGEMERLAPRMVCVELDPPGDRDWFKRTLANAGLRNQEIVGGNLLAWK